MSCLTKVIQAAAGGFTQKDYFTGARQPVIATWPMLAKDRFASCSGAGRLLRLPIRGCLVSSCSSTSSRQLALRFVPRCMVRLLSIAPCEAQVSRPTLCCMLDLCSSCSITSNTAMGGCIRGHLNSWLGSRLCHILLTLVNSCLTVCVIAPLA